MPGEISHVIYAARVLTNVSDQVKDPLYWVGTLLPNIGKLGAKSRFPLHPRNVSLYSLLGQSDFATGMRVHAWMDETFGQYWETQRVADKLPWNPLTRIAYKLIEDQELYDHFDDWNLIHRLINKVNDEELKLVQDKSVIEKWHSTLQDYVSDQPSDASRKKFLCSLGVSRKLADEINVVVTQLYKKEEVHQAMHEAWRNVEDLLM